MGLNQIGKLRYNMFNKVSILSLSILLLATTFSQSALAESSHDEKLEFAGTLEETLGHFWALESNLDEGNAELALIHATHPIAELYDTMSQHLAENPEFDVKIQETLMELQNRANTEVSREDAQAAIDEAKEIIQEARMIVVGEELSNDDSFKMQLINGLLETSKVEYTEAITDGIIDEIAEFQDGSAFVWRSQQIFNELELETDTTSNITSQFEELWSAFDAKVEPSEMHTLTDGIIEGFVSVSGIESTESKHMEEAFGHLSPLKQQKAGVAPSDVICKAGLELVFQPDGDAVCVKSSSVSKVLSIGWTN